MAKKILLETRSEPALYTLFGISCHLRDYHLIFLLNEALNLAFVKMDDFLGYSFYYCRDEDCFNAYHLLGNRGDESFLIPELKQTDFLLLAEGPFKKTQKERLLEKIRNIQSVLTSFEIRFETIKNYETILNELEIHFMKINKESKITYSPVKK